jgi:hypothetical protein
MWSDVERCGAMWSDVELETSTSYADDDFYTQCIRGCWVAAGSPGDHDRSVGVQHISHGHSAADVKIAIAHCITALWELPWAPPRVAL